MKRDATKKLDKLAWWLDSSIRVPGTQWRVGLDGIIGLIPGVGDVVSGAISSYILAQAYKMGVAPIVIVRMALNIIFESAVGAIPVIGDLFDFAFKANIRNMNLMHRYLDSPDIQKTKSTFSVGVIIIAVVAFLVLILYTTVKLIAWIWQGIT